MQLVLRASSRSEGRCVVLGLVVVVTAALCAWPQTFSLTPPTDDISRTPGPDGPKLAANIYSDAAQRAWHVMSSGQDVPLFHAALEEEFQELRRQKERRERPEVGIAVHLDGDAKEMYEKERVQTATELLYLKVCSKFSQLQVPPIPTLKGGGDIRFSQGSDELQGLTEIYSVDSLELVRDHLFGIISRNSGPPVMRMALFQAAQLYSSTMLFGYYLRQAELRYRLEKLVGAYGALRSEEPPPPWASALTWDQSSVTSLLEYIKSFQPEALRRIAQVTSIEANAALDMHISALFGDKKALKGEVIRAVGKCGPTEECSELLQQAVDQQRVKSVRLDRTDFRRLILEASAFGALLWDSERDLGSLYELTPTANL